MALQSLSLKQPKNNAYLHSIIIIIIMGTLTSESWPATRPLARQWDNTQSEPGSWFSTHACSPLCQIQMDAAQN